MTRSVIDKIRGRIRGKSGQSEPLANHTTYRVGGRAAVLVRLRSVDDLDLVAEAHRTSGLPILVVGRGSNLLVADRGFHGIAVVPGDALGAIDPWKRYPYRSRDLARYFASGTADAPRFAIQVDGSIGGVLGLRREWLRGPYIQFLGILPAYQGLGIGTRILAWMEEEVRSHARSLWVCASDFNADAIRLYERQGFHRVVMIEDLVQDGRDEILMRKRLT